MDVVLDVGDKINIKAVESDREYFVSCKERGMLVIELIIGDDGVE